MRGHFRGRNRRPEYRPGQRNPGHEGLTVSYTQIFSCSGGRRPAVLGSLLFQDLLAASSVSRLEPPGLRWLGSCPLMPRAPASIPSLGSKIPKVRRGVEQTKPNQHCQRAASSHCLLQPLKPGVVALLPSVPASHISRARDLRAGGLSGGARGWGKTLVTMNRIASRGRQRIAWIY